MNICPLHITDTQVSRVLLSPDFNLPRVVILTCQYSSQADSMPDLSNIFFIYHLSSIPGHLPVHLVGTGPCRAVTGDAGTCGLIFMTPPEKHCHFFYFSAITCYPSDTSVKVSTK